MDIKVLASGSRSRPTRARGLKRAEKATPGPWYTVAPYAGAWIETPSPRVTRWESLSRPTRARGLKPQSIVNRVLAILSRPTRARGLKLSGLKSYLLVLMSRPTRARGLK